MAWIWELVAEDGKRARLLYGGDRCCCRDGAKVEIHGKIDKAAFGIGMTGPTLSVVSYKGI